MPEAISLKFGMWSTEVGGNVHSKICLVSSRQHRATEVRKLRFLSSCQYTHGVARRLLGPHDTLPCVLIINRMDICIHVPIEVLRKAMSVLPSTKCTTTTNKNVLSPAVEPSVKQARVSLALNAQHFSLTK